MTRAGTARPTGRPTARKTAAAAIAAALAASLALVFIDDAQKARAAAVAALCLVLWLSEAVPPLVPTLLLLALVPVGLGRFGEQFELAAVMSWGADPVLALFFGSFALGVAARRHGIDAALARLIVRAARGKRAQLLLLVMAGTAFLSMWMSNIAAAAMMLAALHPLAAGAAASLRRPLLVALALGANLGGMATPVGTGPNAIAVAALARSSPITFAHWMAFALPLTVVALLAGFGLVIARFRASGALGEPLDNVELPARRSRGAAPVLAIFAACAVLWLSEPLHGVPASVTGLGAAALLFASGLLTYTDVRRIDWSTLLLIGGGILLGRLLEASGILDAFASAVDWHALTPFARTFALVFASALLSALMSNTATASMLIPLASSFDPSAATPVLLAVGCSFGFPFIISTPPNAMVAGQGARSSDLLAIGLPMMLLGCFLVSLTGHPALAFFGVG